MRPLALGSMPRPPRRNEGICLDTRRLGDEKFSHCLTVDRRFTKKQEKKMHRLAKVELQLVMHGLDTQSRVRLARCCRRALAAADSIFAWKYAPIVGFNASTHTPPPSPSFVQLRHFHHHLYLSRHIPLKITSPTDFIRAATTNAAADHHHPLYTVHEIDARDIVPQDWTRLLSHVHLGSIEFIQSEWTRQPTNQIYHPVLYTRLHTVRFDGVCRKGSMGTAFFVSLPTLPALTSLRLSSFRTTDGRDCVDVVSRCPFLTRLHFDDDDSFLYLPGNRLVFLLSQPLMQQNLHFLCLPFTHARDDEQQQLLGRAFASMQALRTIHCCSTDRFIIRALLNAPAVWVSLKLLVFENRDTRINDHPSPAQIACLLQRYQKLCVCFDMKRDYAFLMRFYYGPLTNGRFHVTGHAFPWKRLVIVVMMIVFSYVLLVSYKTPVARVGHPQPWLHSARQPWPRSTNDPFPRLPDSSLHATLCPRFIVSLRAPSSRLLRLGMCRQPYCLAFQQLSNWERQEKMWDLVDECADTMDMRSCLCLEEAVDTEDERST